MRSLAVLLLFLSSLSAFAAEQPVDPSFHLYFEFDQMFVLKVGTEYRFKPDWGIKGGIGVSVPGVTTVGYQLTGVYHVTNPENRFQMDLELGLPIAYFNVLEGAVVDWDPTIDDPFAGWAPGIGVAWGYRLAGGEVLSLKTGAVMLFEYQRDSGWREDHPVIPALALQLML